MKQMFKRILGWRPPKPESKAGILFDVMGGILFPVLCFALDPVFFRSGGESAAGLLGDFMVMGYLSLSLSITCLLVSFFRKTYSPLLQSALLVSSGIALCFAAILSPFMLMGLLVLQPVALFGLVPFWTGLSFQRRSKIVKVLPTRNTDLAARFSRFHVYAAALLLIGFPGLIQWPVSHFRNTNLEVMRSGTEAEVMAAADKLKPFRVLINKRRLMRNTMLDQDRERRGWRVAAYNHMFDEDLIAEWDAWIAAD